jgi:TRAP-type mannitol/chloroaromatic compound transport system substrate-binding protein
MPPFECFDATSKGTIEAYMGAASYWTGKDPAAEHGAEDAHRRPR